MAPTEVGRNGLPNARTRIGHNGSYAKRADYKAARLAWRVRARTSADRPDTVCYTAPGPPHVRFRSAAV